MSGKGHPSRPLTPVFVREAVDPRLLPTGTVYEAVWVVPTNEKSNKALMHVDTGGASPSWVVCQEATQVRHELWDLEPDETSCMVCGAKWPLNTLGS